MRSLALGNLNNLWRFPPCLFIKALHDVEFSSLKNLHSPPLNVKNIYCQLQTQSFESTHQLANGMKLINSNIGLINGINNLYLSTIIRGDERDSDDSDNENDFEQICDILHEWIENGKKNILLSIKIAINTQDDNKYCEKFAVCLCNKIDTKNSKNNEKMQSDNSNCVESLKKQNFTSTCYGGNSSHCKNEIFVNDRVTIGVNSYVK